MVYVKDDLDSQCKTLSRDCWKRATHRNLLMIRGGLTGIRVSKIYRHMSQVSENIGKSNDRETISRINRSFN